MELNEKHANHHIYTHSWAGNLLISEKREREIFTRFLLLLLGDQGYFSRTNAGCLGYTVDVGTES